MKQRKWTAEEKLAIVLEGLKEKMVPEKSQIFWGSSMVCC